MTAATPARRSTAAFKRAGGAGWAALFVLPLFAGVVVFYLWPIVRNLWFSFTEWGPFGGAEWVGLDNYRQLITDHTLYRSILNTFAYTAILILSVPLAVGFAALLNRPGLRFVLLFRMAFFLPYVAMPSAISMVWRIIYNGNYGVINYALGLVGIDGPNWLSTEWVALFAVALVGAWSALGFNLIVLSAGMKGIPPEMYEAAEIDGASRWRQFRSISVPLLTPSLFFVVVISVVNGFQVFDLFYAMMGTGNPVMPRTQPVVYYFFSNVESGNNGYAAAIGMLLLVLVGLFTAIQFRLQRRWVHYA